MIIHDRPAWDRAHAANRANRQTELLFAMLQVSAADPDVYAKRPGHTAAGRAVTASFLVAVRRVIV